MSLMPLHFTLCKDVTHGHVYVYWWRDVSTSECILRMQLRTVYEQTLLPNATTTNFDSDPTHPTHPTHPTSHITSESVSKCSSHRVLYTGTLHPLPPLFMRHHTNLLLFIVIYYLFEDVILNVMGYRSHVSSVDRSVVLSRRRAFHVQYRIHLN